MQPVWLEGGMSWGVAGWSVVEAPVVDVDGAVGEAGDALVLGDDDGGGAGVLHLGRMSSMTWSPRALSSADVGSSNWTSVGSFISARPMATRALSAGELRWEIRFTVCQADLFEEWIGAPCCGSAS